MPPISDLDDKKLLSFLKDHSIGFVIPTRDGELPFWAKHAKYLKENKIGVMISSIDSIEICEDKLEFGKFFQNSKIPSIQTTLNPGVGLTGCKSIIVKERRGSASESIGLNLELTDAIEHAKHLNEPIFQPQITGKELSAETWIDQNGNCNGVLLRWRLKVVNGESHETKIFQNKKWSDMLKETFSKLKGLRGHVLAQVIVDNNENLHLIEINPRLGGASPLALKGGLHSIKWSLWESNEMFDLIPTTLKIAYGLSLHKQGSQVSIF